MSVGAKFAIFLAKAIIAILIGNVLFHVVVNLPFDMPYRLDMASRWLLHGLGRDDLANPDDMEIIVGLAAALMTTAVGAVIVWGGHALVKRMSAARRSHA